MLEWVLRTEPANKGLLDYRYWYAALPCKSWYFELSVNNLSVDATIASEYRRTNAPSKRVDFCLPIKLSEEEKEIVIDSCWTRPGHFINHTDWGDLRSSPIALSIKTMDDDGGGCKAFLHIGTWLSAQWRSLARGAKRPQKIEFLPGIVVRDDRWVLVACIAPQDDTEQPTLLRQIDIGSTDSVLGIYKLIASLQCLRNWAETVFWPAYREEILEMAPPSPPSPPPPPPLVEQTRNMTTRRGKGKR